MYLVRRHTTGHFYFLPQRLKGIKDLLSKARDIYFTANLQSAWFVVPGLNIIHVTTPNGQTATFQQNEKLVDPVTGIEVEFREVFR